MIKEKDGESIKRRNLEGEKFGRWTVIKDVDSKRSLCECGTVKSVLRHTLLNGCSKSCGCYQREHLSSKRKQNSYDLSGKYGIGYTSKGKIFYFDLEDYDKIKDYCWGCNKEGYLLSRKDDKTIRLHRLIMNCTNPKIFIDHINHNVKDNRKINLRIVDNNKNQMNAKLRNNNTSSCTGVCYNHKANKWIANIQVNKKRIFLGQFNKFENAVQARKQAEEKYFGEYSYDNSMERLRKDSI